MNTATSYLKKFVKDVPVIGLTARKIAKLPILAGARRKMFPGSAAYWEKRYREGGTSGCGSYRHLAEFKAEILNEFVRRKEIQSVVELGCGNGAQLELAKYPEYVGIDVACTAIEQCFARFKNDRTKHFYVSDLVPEDLGLFDLALSVDVIFHLVEDDVFNGYMRSLFARSRRYVVIYASNYDALTEGAHVRHRRFTDWISSNMPGWQTIGAVKNRFPFDARHPDETSFSDFHFFAKTDRPGCADSK